MATVLGNENLETSMMKESSIGTMATVTIRKMAPKLKAEPRKETLQVCNCAYYRNTEHKNM